MTFLLDTDWLIQALQPREPAFGILDRVVAGGVAIGWISVAEVTHIRRLVKTLIPSVWLAEGIGWDEGECGVVARPGTDARRIGKLFVPSIVKCEW